MSLSRNAAYTMTSAVLQIGVTLVTIPIYLSVIGLERYGVVVVIWLLFEYVMIFNLGLDRAAINFLSKHIGDRERSSSLFWTAIGICLVTGAAGALLVHEYLADFMVRFLSVSPVLLGEVHYGFMALAIMVIVGIVGTILSSLLQSQERFLELNISQFVMSVVFQVVPVTAASFLSPTLETVIVSGCIGRSVQTLLYLYFCLRPKHRPLRPSFSRPDAAAMLRYGAWTSVTGIISPLVFNLDRMAISSMLGSAAVALYTVPYNLVMKAQLIPTSLSSVLFPRLSQSSDIEGRLATAGQALLSLAIILAPGLIIGSFLLEPFLTLWIHKFVSKETVVVGQILILGIWFNGLAIMPYIWLQATGRPDVVAKIHTAEIVPFVIVLWLLVHNFGIVGAAVAWSIRAVADSLALFYLSGMHANMVRNLAFPFACVFASVIITSVFTLSLVMSAILVLAFLVILMVWSVRVAPDSLKARFGPLRDLLMRRRQLRS
ncbi:MAG: polysaccharide biosynthesis protein [Rhizobium sp.]|nr:polysaccharide biosynthesis protein [Rhizobium sp.]